MQKKSTLWQAVLAVSVASALALPAFAQSQRENPRLPSPSSSPSSGGAGMQSSGQVEKAMADKATTEADRILNQHIRQALSGDTTLAAVAKNIHIEADNGEVTLHGSVATAKEKADIAAKVQQVAGVKKLDNQLQVASSDIRGGATSGSMNPSAGSSKGSYGGTSSREAD